MNNITHGPEDILTTVCYVAVTLQQCSQTCSAVQVCRCAVSSSSGDRTRIKRSLFRLLPLSESLLQLELTAACQWVDKTSHEVFKMSSTSQHASLNRSSVASGSFCFISPKTATFSWHARQHATVWRRRDDLNELHVKTSNVSEESFSYSCVGFPLLCSVVES